ncbi:hypothetical protein OC834_005491 [Tilletia horrida]|uniref:Ribonuclease H1 N-terminal domain-containing protein n=1 Tax=Tilletia horrida TaxID=155126 RepID=A0AAN6JNK0_9BASI|nr:hypothetical protein OC834_005491 [Tilletia horrida]KAK0536633.1 hypothetical protein OC835_001983 [Tilletia horrida]KAK0540811.1 hypothetical protein OC842_000264 [Tilletia horrida]KAK0567595.1 hypothetical protein OC844_000178 [Tilletia horrida]
MSKPTKFYGVAVGDKIGVYDNPRDAKNVTNGYPGNNCLAFRSQREAHLYVGKGGAPSKKAWVQSQGSGPKSGSRSGSKSK